MQLHASPGIVLIKPVTSSKKELSFSSNNDKLKVARGIILDVGDPVITDFGAKISCSYKVGDTVYFLKYEGGYDSSMIDGQEYIWAFFKDLRGVEGE
jgi:co-chaperonin GroES (HSP10)